MHLYELLECFAIISSMHFIFFFKMNHAMATDGHPGEIHHSATGVGTIGLCTKRHMSCVLQ